MQKDKIVLSGMRPTGKLHLGNFHGALKNWVALQDKYNCYFFVADLHSLTTAYEHTENLAENSRNMLIDWLTAGLDPEKSTIFIQSDVPEVSELNTLLGMITPLGWLLRNPTYKEQIQELLKQKYAGQLDEKSLGEKINSIAGDEEISSFGFLGYPVLMATDILIQQAAYVPVGKDQTAHLEIARDLARRFAEIYGEAVFTEPAPLYTEVARVPGLDGRKMSKSYHNAINLGEDLDSVRKKVMTMFTDPNKKKATDPANPEGCVVYAFHRIYNPNAAKRCEECKAGALGCVACKKELFALMEPEMKAFSERRKLFENDEALLQKIVAIGKDRARANAAKTLATVKKVMRITR
ncbi:tryptophan--tRNA ligase [Candidatus Avelusimicrobium gallicola]|uniref:Tryptophan--tRNA ligase n=1 Tax=Candidatus Avelusimicrobium gallicola TaxID=2562704 RepID=A0A1Y4DP92_9BACT|nr:tryptophan--tRNA ligase [Elusimicrobium sp. An273]OUO57211.1 tryptophan--tRNA ligase [Elusimicrobium sp. An273]